MSPSTKDKIREDVQDAMADKEEGNFRVVIKSRGPGIFPGYFYWKIEAK